MPIPLLDLVAQYESLREELMPAIARVLGGAQFILGEEVERFEDHFASYCQVPYCVGVSSGTEALHLTLRALGVGPGDEVITVANTFAATAFAIRYAGASPVFVDVSPTDYNMDAELIEQAITSRTRAILPVHLYGQPADMDTIVRLAQKHGLAVLEDACQAHGAQIGPRRVGSIGHAGCFSFYPGKNLGAYGDGGAVVTRDAQLADKLRLLRNYGQRAKNDHTVLGFNSRLDTLQAAVLLVKLRHLDTWNEQRRALARLYGELLAGTDVVVPQEKPHVRHVYHLYVVQHTRRDRLVAHLRQMGIFCGIHYPIPLHHAAPFAAARTVPEGLPVTTALSKRILSLPIYAELTGEQAHHVVEQLSGFCAADVELQLSGKVAV